MLESSRIDAIVDFWFLQTPQRKWFLGGEAFDRQVRKRFHNDIEPATQHSCTSARDFLGTILLLDQVPRNIFRGQARAFACDQHARALTLTLLERGLDLQLRPEERLFAYLPLEHAEDLDMQDRAVALYQALGLEEAYAYALRHQAVIRRFGRFPARNQALGRNTTRDESDFLQKHPEGF